tara:strand:- start:99 stop:299 length:201 start_codon:yes stop_codon:yes gene_type:complete
MTEKEKFLMAHMQLSNVCKLLNGRLQKFQTLDYTGKRTTKYTIEFDTPEKSDSTDPDVSGSNSSDT